MLTMNKAKRAMKAKKASTLNWINFNKIKIKKKRISPLLNITTQSKVFIYANILNRSLLELPALELDLNGSVNNVLLYTKANFNLIHKQTKVNNKLIKTSKKLLTQSKINLDLIKLTEGRIDSLTIANNDLIFMNYEIWNLQRPTYINNLFIKKYFSMNLNHTIRNSYINNLFRQTKEFLETSNRRRRHDLDLKANHARKLLIRIVRNRNGVDFTSKRKEEQIYRDRVRRWTKKFLKRGRLTKDQRVIYFHRQLKREFLSHSMTFRALNSVAKAKTIKPINTSYSLR